MDLQEEGIQRLIRQYSELYPPPEGFDIRAFLINRLERMKRLGIPPLQATEMLDTDYLVAVGAMPDPTAEDEIL